MGLDVLEQTLLRELGEPIVVADLDWTRAHQLVHVLVRRGQVEDADVWIRHLGELDAALPEGERTFVEGWLRCRLLYCTQNRTALEGETTQPGFPATWRQEVAFWLAVESGQVEGLDPRQQDGLEKLAVSLVHARSKDRGLMTARVDEALEELVAVDPAYRVFRDLWDGRLDITPAHLDRIVAEPHIKALLLTVLASRHEEHRRMLLRQARHFNYGLEFPHNLLASFDGTRERS